MLSTKCKLHRWMGITLLIFGVAVALVGLWAPAQAGPALPPRQPPTTPQPDNDKKHDRDKPIGAYIELQAPTAAAGSWTVVQWQDSAGNWREVEGWQGPLEGHSKLWWVAAADFGKGPFRWIILSGPGGSVSATSNPFNLPNGANEIVRVQVGK